jgi:hypothetical protein
MFIVPDAERPQPRRATNATGNDTRWLAKRAGNGIRESGQRSSTGGRQRKT